MWLVYIVALLVIFLISTLYRPIWWNRAYNRVRLMLAFAYYYTAYKVPTQNAIFEFKNELNKIPKHVAFIFNETSYRCSSLADNITWFSILGVETVTFYSQHAAEEKTIQTIFNSLRYKYSGQVTRIQNKIILAEDTVNNDNTRNGNRLEVIFIDKIYGKPMITKLASKVVSESKNEGLLTVDGFHKEVVGEVAFSAPELAMIFGPAFSTCGYPPWHLQFTEMHHFFSHKYIQWGQVHHVLKTFANTKQNYGK